MTRHRTPALAIVVALLFVGGCRSEPAAPPPSTPVAPAQQRAGWPEKLADFRFRWTADPGVDLATGWAVPLRAYLESWLVVLYTGDPEAGYPGYDRATPPVLSRNDRRWASTPAAQREIRSLRDLSAYAIPDQRIVGNEQFDILRTEPIPSGFRAIVCDSTFGVYDRRGNSPRYSPLNLRLSTDTAAPDVHNMKVWRIEFSDKDSRVGPTPPRAPAAPAQGPLPAPRDDVFGPWFVTGATDVTLWYTSDFPDPNPAGPESTQRRLAAQAEEAALRQQCLDRLPLTAEQRTSLATTVVDTPPATEPPVPGWPG